MKYLFILFLITFSNLLIGQITPYEINDFANLNPLWQHLPSDSSTIEIDESEFNGINHFSFHMNMPGPFIIQDKYLFIGLNTSIQMQNLNEGGYVEKIDLETGTSLWKDHFDLRDSNHKEFIESLTIDDSGRLKVITTRDIEPTYPEDYDRIGYAGAGDSSYISIRLYDTLSGHLVDHIINETSLDSTQWIYYDTRNNSILKPAAENLYYYNLYDYFNDAYCQYIMNEKGRLSEEVVCDSITFDLPFDEANTSQENRAKMFRVSEDTLITLDYLKNDENESIQQVKITLYNKYFQKSKIIPLDTILKFNYRTLRLRAADENYIYLFGMIPGAIPHTSWDDTMAHCVINWDGIPEYEFKNLYEGVRLGELVLCHLNNENELLLVERSSDPSGFDFFTTNKETDAGFELLKRIYYNNPNYVFTVHELYQLKNGDILLYGLNKTKPDWSDYYIGNWHTFIRIPAEDLGLETGVENPKVVKQTKPVVYPNPAQNDLNIKLHNECDCAVFIYDVLGNLVLASEMSQSKYLKLNISNLPSGMYYAKVKDESNGMLKYENISFIKN